jgi:hypothetical protein
MKLLFLFGLAILSCHATTSCVGGRIDLTGASNGSGSVFAVCGAGGGPATTCTYTYSALAATTLGGEPKRCAEYAYPFTAGDPSVNTLPNIIYIHGGGGHNIGTGPIGWTANGSQNALIPTMAVGGGQCGNGVGCNVWWPTYQLSAWSTLAGALNCSSQTSVSGVAIAATGSGFWPNASGYVIQVDSEQMLVTAHSGSEFSAGTGGGGPFTLTVTCGYNSTTKANHANGAFVWALDGTTFKHAGFPTSLGDIACMASGMAQNHLGNPMDIRVVGTSHGAFIAAFMAMNNFSQFLGTTPCEWTSTAFKITRVEEWSGIPDQGASATLHLMCNSTGDCNPAGGDSTEPQYVAGLMDRA